MASKKISVGLIDEKSMHLFTDFITENPRELLDSGNHIIVLGAVSQDMAVGALCGYMDDDDYFNVLSFYVAGAYRRQGVGTALLDSLCDSLDGLSDSIVIRISYCEGDEESEALSEFLKARGCREIDRGERLYIFPVKCFDNDILFSRRYVNPRVRSFLDLTVKELAYLSDTSFKKYRDQPEEGFLSSRVNRKCSFVYYKKKKIRGYLVCDDTEGGELTVSALFALDNLAMAGLLHSFAEAVKNEYSGEKKIYMPVTTSRFDALFETLLPGVKNLEKNYELL